MSWNWGMLPFVAVLLTLVWRVWRLEARVICCDRRRDDNYDTLAVRINNLDAMVTNRLRSEREFHEAHRRSTNDLATRLGLNVTALATALGYEWKRTEAKEGWERKSEELYLEYVPMSLHDIRERYHREYDWTLPTTNRRKADRRKADDSLAAHLAPVCGACFKGADKASKTPKKPTRTGAKRGPQRRAH